MIETEGVASGGFLESDFRKWVESQASIRHISPTAVSLPLPTPNI